MKLTKRICILLIVTFSLVLFNCFHIYAFSSTSDAGNATWNVDDETVTTYNHGLTHSLAYGTTTTNALSKEGSQMINVFSMKTDGVNSMLVSWAVQRSTYGYTRLGLSHIAEDYEKKHPGWIVVAGINGDQYYDKYGGGISTNGSFYYYNQPYYPLIMDNEARFAITPFGISGSNYVGIRNNNESDSFLPSSALKGLSLELIDEKGNIKESYNVDKINEKPSDGQIAVWFSYNGTEHDGEYVTFDLNSNNNIYLVENPEHAYMSNSRFYPVGAKVDAVFGRGVISKITKQCKVDAKQFAVEASDDRFLNILKEGTRIRVEFVYENEEMNNVESCFGYHSIQRMDGQDIIATQQYDTARYNRSIFGKKADGTYVLMTVAKANYSGTTHDESNAILKYYGVTEAYQQDGGGSVTAIVRNEKGSFDVVNESSDGGVTERSILSGCFFVVRDPGYVIYGKDSTRTSLTITKINNYNDEYISNVTARINDQVYELNDTLTITGLKEDTLYEIILNYTVTNNGKSVNVENILTAKTDAYVAPSSTVSIDNINAISVVLKSNVLSDIYKSIIVNINNKEYDLLNNKEIKIKDLERNTAYKAFVTYEIYDELTASYKLAKEELEFMTKETQLPEISLFEVKRTGKDKVQIDVEIEDLDNIIVQKYIMYNVSQNASIEMLTNSKQTINIFDLNIEENECSFQIVIEYRVDGVKEIYKSDYLKVTKDTEYPNDEKQDENKEEKKKKCGKKNIYIPILLMLSQFVVLIFRKEK